MIAVITGDIIKSRKVNPEVWLPKLRTYFFETISEPDKWDIYRGDSFQVEVDIKEAVNIVFCIKAMIKSLSIIDVRMSIGLGEKSFQGETISESNGTAFLNSGLGLESLKDSTIIIKSPFAEINEYFNTILKLVSFISDNWKPITANTIFYALSHRDLLQKEIAAKLSKDSTTVNKALKRGGYDEILEISELYSKKISQCLNLS